MPHIVLHIAKILPSQLLQKKTGKQHWKYLLNLRGCILESTVKIGCKSKIWCHLIHGLVLHVLDFEQMIISYHPFEHLSKPKCLED